MQGSEARKIRNLIKNVYAHHKGYKEDILSQLPSLKSCFMDLEPPVSPNFRFLSHFRAKMPGSMARKLPNMTENVYALN